MVTISPMPLDAGYVNIKYSTDGGQTWITPTGDFEVPEGTSLMVEAGYPAARKFVKYEYIPTGASGIVYTTNPVTFTVELGSNVPQPLHVYGAERTAFKFCKKGTGVNQMSYWKPQQTVNVGDNETVYLEPASTGIANVNSTFNVGYEFDKVELRNRSGTTVIQTYTTLPVNITGVSAGSTYQIWIYGKQGKVTITVEQPENGNINPGTGDYDIGSTPTFAVTPSTGYRVKNIKVDGQPVIWRR